MVEPEPMSLPERRKYLRLVQPHYLRAGRRERSAMLDEGEQVTGRHCESLIRLLRVYLAFAHLDIVAQTNLLNQIYDHMWLLHSLSHRMIRLLQERHQADGGLARTYEPPQPGFDRLCPTGVLESPRHAELHELPQATNSLQLRNQTHALLARLCRLPKPHLTGDRTSTAPYFTKPPILNMLPLGSVIC